MIKTIFFFLFILNLFDFFLSKLFLKSSYYRFKLTMPTTSATTSVAPLPNTQQSYTSVSSSNSSWEIARVKEIFHNTVNVDKTKAVELAHKALKDHKISLLGSITSAESFVVGLQPIILTTSSLLWPNSTQNSDSKLLSTMPWGGVLFCSLFKGESLKAFMTMNTKLFLSGFTDRAASLYTESAEDTLDKRIKGIDNLLNQNIKDIANNAIEIMKKTSEWKKLPRNKVIDCSKDNETKKQEKLKLAQHLDNYNPEEIATIAKEDIVTRSKEISAWFRDIDQVENNLTFDISLSTALLKYNEMLTNMYQNHLTEKNNSEQEHTKSIKPNAIDNVPSVNSKNCTSLLECINELIHLNKNHFDHFTLTLLKRFELSLDKFSILRTKAKTNEAHEPYELKYQLMQAIGVDERVLEHFKNYKIFYEACSFYLPKLRKIFEHEHELELAKDTTEFHGIRINKHDIMEAACKNYKNWVENIIQTHSFKKTNSCEEKKSKIKDFFLSVLQPEFEAKGKLDHMHTGPFSEQRSTKPNRYEHASIKKDLIEKFKIMEAMDLVIDSMPDDNVLNTKTSDEKPEHIKEFYEIIGKSNTNCNTTKQENNQQKATTQIKQAGDTLSVRYNKN